MYDTIEMRIPKAEQNYSVDTLATALYNYHVKTDEVTQQSEIRGYLRGCNNCDMEVFANEDVILLGKRSIAKWILGNNLEQPKRSDIIKAFDEIGDRLQVNINEAIISRFDIGVNMPVSKDVNQYLTRLGTLHGKLPIRNESSLYYNCNGGKLVIYDKMAEIKAKHEPVPPKWMGRNVLRCEQRYLLPSKYYHHQIRANELTSQEFYYNCVQNLHDELQSIVKHEILFDMEQIFCNGVKVFRSITETLGVMALANELGGFDKLVEQLNVSYKGNANKKKEKSDILKYITSCYGGNFRRNVDEVTKELKEQIEQIATFAK